MRQEELRDLYWENVTLMDIITELIRSIRIQNEHKMIVTIPMVTGRLSTCLKGIMSYYEEFQKAGLSWNMNYLLSIMNCLEQCQKTRDYIYMGDIYEMKLLPALQEVQNVIYEMEIPLIKDEWLEENLRVLEKKNIKLAEALCDYGNMIPDSEDAIQYSIQPSEIGCFTLAWKDGDIYRYFHSIRNPFEEARLFAKRSYRLEQERYLLVGWGMGYHVRELLKLYSDMDLVVMEPNLGILYYSLACGDWREELEKVRILWDPEWKEFVRTLQEDREFLLFRPELAHIQNEQIREKLIHLANRKDSIDDFREVFYQNCRENIRNCNAYVDEIKPDIRGKRVVIVAGGPSLDRNLEQLLNKPEDVIILAVGTVYKLLLKKGIPVDYVVCSDAFIYPQIQGIEDRQIPILILATADRRVSRYYQGPKYLVCQKGYEMAVNYAAQHGVLCYDSGGSVVTLALDIAIRMQAASIAFIGLDLAYYGNRAHAAGTAEENFAGYEHHVVKGKHGENLNSSQAFIQYRLWLEHRIQNADVTMKIYDATENGAKKEGFIDITLCEYLNGTS